MRQHIDDDLELPLPDWIQRIAYALDKDVAKGYTSLRKVRKALEFLGMIEVDDFCCPIPEVNLVTGQITFIWPATRGTLLVTIHEESSHCHRGFRSLCVIRYEKDFGINARQVGGPSLLRQELVKLYPFLKWRWERTTLP